MLGWLYAKARQFKKFMLFASGLGVGVSTATMLVSPVISWIMNLVAIAGSGGYSVLKNMEIAESVADCQRDTASIVEKLSLRKYQEETLPDVLKTVTSFSDEEIQHIERELRQEFARNSRWYANFNLIAQMVLGVTSLVINAIANSAAEKKDNPSTAKNILNMSVVPLCILLQCLLHIVYVAKNLRTKATESEDLQVKLSSIHDSLLFRVRERNAFLQSKQRIEGEIGRLSEEITTIEQRNAEFENHRVKDLYERNVISKNYERLRAQFRELDVIQYLLIDDEGQLRDKLAKDFPSIQNMKELIIYVQTKKRYDDLMTRIDARNREIDENKAIMEPLVKECEELRIKYQHLEAEDPRFRKIETELAKLEEIKRPLSV